MELKKYESEYPKEALELGLYLKKLMQLAAKAKEDGWQTMEDLVAIFSGSLPELMQAMDGVQKLVEEGKEAPIKVGAAVLMPVSDGVSDLYQSFKKQVG